MPKTPSAAVSSGCGFGTGEAACKLYETHRAIARRKSSVAIAQLVLRDAELRGRMRTREIDELLAEHFERAAGAEHAARAAGAVTDEIGARRARIKTDLRGVDTERFGHDLRKHGFVTLAGRLRDGEERHVAVRIELDGDLVLGRRAAAARFEIGRDADAAKLAGRAALPRGAIRNPSQSARFSASSITARKSPES